MTTVTNKHTDLDKAIYAQQKELSLVSDDLGFLGYPIALHKDFKIVEPKTTNLPQRPHFAAKIKTPNTESFIQYAKANQQKGTTCFIDPDNISAVMIIDQGTKETPLHNLHTITNALDQTAPFKALLAINGAQNTQKYVAEFIEEWRDYLTFKDNENADMKYSEALHAFRNITISAKSESESSVGNTSQSRSAFESVDADTENKLPHRIIFNCVPYQGLEEHELQLSVSVITKQEPIIVLRILQLEKHQEAFAIEFSDLITDQLSDTDIKTYIGRLT